MEALDNEDYDPVVHLQLLFSTPSNLSRLPDIVAGVKTHHNTLNREIDRANKQTKDYQNEDYYQRIQEGNTQLENLYSEIDDLREESKETEAKISEMTSHIISLDKTKSNLIYSITVLKRLQMLTTAYEQLSTLVKNKHYREMAQTLPAVQELMSHFKPFRSIPEVATLNQQISKIQVKITDQIFSDFEAMLSGKGDSDLASNLADATLVLDCLDDENSNFSGGHSSKKKLINWYCSTQLRQYRTIFNIADEAGSLENISKRYAFFKRLLKEHVENYAKFFNPSWHMAEELANAFCNYTCDDIKTLLAQGGKNINVQLLLKALQDTLEFEQYMEKRFASVSNSIPSKKDANSSSLESGKAISMAFQPHLNIWIDHQDRQLSLKFAQYKAPPAPSSDGANDNPEPTVLPSSADLFIFYRQILAQTAKLSTGEPLYNLSKLFAKWLDTFCNQILRPTFPARLNEEDDYKTLALVVATADYCFNTTGQLEEKLQSTVDEQYKDQITFDREKGIFLEIVNTGIKMLVSRVESVLEYSWREMVNTNWAKLDSVGDQSSYVSELNKNLLAETEHVLKYTSKKTYSRLVCDKIVESVANSFLLCISKCRPISEVASEQMLLDMYVIKNTLLKLPSLAPGVDPSTPPSTLYVKHVNGGSSIGRVETILKVILTQANPPEGLVQNYFYLIGDKSVTNFKKILEFKGITSRSEQSRFLELFNAHMKAHDKLVEESPILQPLKLTGAGGASLTNSTSNGPNLNSTTNGSSAKSGISIFTNISNTGNNIINNSSLNSNGGLRSISGSSLTFGLGSSISRDNTKSPTSFFSTNNSSRASTDGRTSNDPSFSLSPQGIHIPKFDTPKGLSMAKDQIERSIEKLSLGDGPSVSKFNENIKNFGRLFRRDTGANNTNQNR